MASGSCANTPSPDHFRPMLASLPTLLCEQSSSGTIHAIQYCAIGLVGVKNMTEKNSVPILGQNPKLHIWSYRKSLIGKKPEKLGNPSIKSRRPIQRWNDRLIKKTLLMHSSICQSELNPHFPRTNGECNVQIMHLQNLFHSGQFQMKQNCCEAEK